MSCHLWLIEWETAPGWPGEYRKGADEICAPKAQDAVYMWEVNLPGKYGKTVKELRRFVSISHIREVT